MAPPAAGTPGADEGSNEPAVAFEGASENSDSAFEKDDYPEPEQYEHGSQA